MITEDMLRFQVDSCAIKLLEKAAEPATFAISRSHQHSPTKYCTVIVIVCSTKNLEHWKGTPLFANSWPRHVPCKFMKIPYNVVQYHTIFHEPIVTRNPPLLLYELLARCAWANRRIYAAARWIVCLDPSVINWDMLIWFDTIWHSGNTEWYIWFDTDTYSTNYI